MHTRRFLLVAVLVCLAVVTPTGAWAGQGQRASESTTKPATLDSAGGLREICDSTDLTMVGLCIGYIHGVSTTLDVLGRTECRVPEGVNLQQMVEVTKKWLKDHPEKWHESSIGSLISVMSTFCKK